MIRQARALALVAIITGISLLVGKGEAQTTLKPELWRAAEVRAMIQACQERQPELAEQVITVVNGWWERNPQVAEAVHALYFGSPSLEQLAQQRAFEDLQQRFLSEAQRSQAADPEVFLGRCRLLLDQLGREMAPPVETEHERGSPT